MEHTSPAYLNPSTSNDPISAWKKLHDPDDITRERAIRADQKRLDFRELEATAKTLRFLIDRLNVEALAAQGIDIDTLERIHRVSRQLLVAVERKAQAA